MYGVCCYIGCVVCTVSAAMLYRLCAMLEDHLAVVSMSAASCPELPLSGAVEHQRRWSTISSCVYIADSESVRWVWLTWWLVRWAPNLYRVLRA